MWPVINRHFRSGRLSELNESVAVPLNPINNNRIDDRSGRPPSIPSPLPSDLNPEILDWIRTLDPAELERIYAILDKIQQLDPAEFLGLSLKEKNKKEEEEKRRETEKENEKGRESESSGIGGENQNGGEVEKEEESSTRNQYPLRPEAGDCWWYLKTGNCKFGSNCKFNHPRRRKNKQKVSKDKAKQREEFAEKQDQAEGKKKVSKDKTKQREDLAKSKVCNCIDDQSDHPLFIQSPLPSDLNPEILEWIQGLDPTELDRTYAIFDQFQQFDPAFENWNFNPSIVDEIRELSLKEREKKEEEEKERESEKENEMEREGESSGIGGGNQNGGEVEDEVVAESSRRKQYPLRPKAGDCLLYLKTGSCKFGSNCKFNHPRGRKNKQVCKDKAKHRVELEEKQDQTESKKKVSKNKAKQKEELAEMQDRTESKVCKDRVKQRVELAKKPDQTKSQVCKDKEKQRVRLAEKPDQTESKVCKDKAKQRVELAKKPDLTKSKVSTDKAKQRERVDREARPDRKQDYYLFDVLYCPGQRKGEPSVTPALELNFLGLPIRPGKNDCLHYMGTGTCKYENSCPFNHPDPTPAEESRPQSAYESRGIHSETTEFITPSWD